MSEDTANLLRQRKATQNEEGGPPPVKRPSSPPKPAEEVVWGKTPSGEGKSQVIVLNLQNLY